MNYLISLLAFVPFPFYPIKIYYNEGFLSNLLPITKKINPAVFYN